MLKIRQSLMYVYLNMSVAPLSVFLADISLTLLLKAAFQL
jgi:hypothetical protein